MTMKKYLLWIGLLIISATLHQCKNDVTDPAALQNVQFTFGLPSQSPSGGRTQAVEPTTLLLSLRNSWGDTVFTNKKIALLHIGSRLMTEPIQLSVGTYSITDFLLTDDDGTVLFATPKAESPLAQAVAHPLPYDFTVSGNDAVTVEMEVLAASESSPEDFGYVTFNINAPNVLRVAVFINQGNSLVLTAAHAAIYHLDNPPIATYNLGAKTNVISFPGDPDNEYRLYVDLNGFPTYTKTFIYSELAAALQGEPLKVIFHQLSIQIDAELGIGPGRDFHLNLEGVAGGAVNVDWGDGSPMEHFTLPAALFHSYLPLQYEITISGDLTYITAFRLGEGGPKIVGMDLTSLVQLSTFEAIHTAGPTSLDLSGNPITSVSLAGEPLLKHLVLPVPSFINDVNINGPNNLTTEEVDAIIKQIHDSVIFWNTQNGHLKLDQNWLTPTGQMVGPPSATGLEMLQDLKDHYHWQILPDPGA
ncbi:hypothetical protein D4L85_34110 [Chryseolinea soli]|uniref:Uncharacterized protein n=2 Tax=Chryseolinea soli TaxID=2321403 RepID=A0A385SWG2_9BACT|nr:hypothetical protein D4L85_34110 [Chryseolinea soli]